MAKRTAAEAFNQAENGVRSTKTGKQQVSAFAAAKAKGASVAQIEAQDESTDGSQDEGHTANTPLTERAVPRSRGTIPNDDDPVDGPLVQYSSPTRTIRISALKDQCQTIALEQDAFVTVLGEYNLVVKSGVISIYGASLHQKSPSQRVYAPTTHALPRITARSGPATVEINSIAHSFSSLSRYSALFKNVSAPVETQASYLILSNGSKDLASIGKSCSMMDTNKQYQQVLTQLAMRSENTRGGITIACIGGKSTGKSSFARHAVNKLISRTSTASCFYLDLDLGQPEFGPPGQIYLVEVRAPVLGPPYTHFANTDAAAYRLVSAHTIAANSFKDNPQQYMDCVKNLFTNESLTRARKMGVAIIVNTCGWVTDLGARVLVDTLQLGVTDAVMIDVSEPILIQAVQDCCQSSYQISRPAAKPSPRAPAELRQMQTMAYFHQRLLTTETPYDPQYRIVDKPISQWRPWIVNYAAGPVVCIVSYGQNIALEFLTEVLDGAVVAMSSHEHDEEFVASLQRTPEGLAHVHMPNGMRPESSQYEGQAIIRGIDVETRSLQLLTPLSDSRMTRIMQRSLVLIRGSFDSPDWAYLEDVVSQPNQYAGHHPWVAQRERTGIEGAVWRMRHPPSAPTRDKT